MNYNIVLSQREKDNLKEILDTAFYKRILLRSLPVFGCYLVVEYLMFFSHLYNFRSFSIDFAVSAIQVQAMVQLISSLQVGVSRYYCARVIVPCIEQDEQQAAHEHFVYLFVNTLLPVVSWLATLTWIHVFIEMYSIPKSYVPYLAIKVVFSYWYSQYYDQTNMIFAVEKRRFMTLARGVLMAIIYGAVEAMLYLCINFNQKGTVKSNWPTYAAYLIIMVISFVQCAIVARGLQFYGYFNHKLINPRKFEPGEMLKLLRAREFWRVVAKYVLSGISYFLCSGTSGYICLIALHQIYSVQLTELEYLHILFKIFVIFFNQFIYSTTAAAISSVHLDALVTLTRARYYRRALKFTLHVVLISLVYAVIPVVLNIFYPPLLTFLPTDDTFTALVTDDIRQAVNYQGIVFAMRFLYEIVVNFTMTQNQLYVVICIGVLKFAATMLPLFSGFKENKESTDYQFILTSVEAGQAVMCVIILLGYVCKFYWLYNDDIDFIKKEQKRKKKKKADGLERKRTG